MACYDSSTGKIKIFDNFVNQVSKDGLAFTLAHEEYHRRKKGGFDVGEEIEADTYALEVVTAGGFDTGRAISEFEQLPLREDWFHLPHGERIEYLKRLNFTLENAPKVYSAKKVQELIKLNKEAFTSQLPSWRVKETIESIIGHLSEANQPLFNLQRPYITLQPKLVTPRAATSTAPTERVWIPERIEGYKRIEGHYEERLAPGGYWQKYEEKVAQPQPQPPATPYGELLGKGWSDGNLVSLNQTLGVGVEAVVRDTYDPLKMYPNVGIKLRKEPGLSEPIIGNLQEGTLVKIIGGPISKDYHTWWEVESPIGRGWVAPMKGRPPSALYKPESTTPQAAPPQP
ncbi:MAG TPA: hypothetical protein ACFYEM_10675 [Candidatus Hypogeohydataceae bacterium YC40]